PAISLRRVFVGSLIIVVAIVAAALAPVWRGVLRAAGRAHLHAPDLALFASLSPAIRIHLLAALGAVALGAVLMILRKGRGFHRVAGWVWVVLVAVVAG